MKNMRSCGLLLTSALVLAVVGCSSNNAVSPAPENNKEKVVLEYYTWTDEADYMQKVIDAFNAKNSGIEVKMNTISNNSNEYNTKIMNNLSGGSTMDLYSINGTSSLGLYASKNQLLDLSDQIKQANLDIGAFGPSYQDIIEVLTDGKYYALPYRTSEYALFYNKAIFDKEGIDYPGQLTWDEYAELASRLTKGEGTDKQWGGYYADWLTAPLGALQKGSTILDDSLDNVAGWLDYLDRLYYQDQSHMSYKQMKAESVDWIKQFESGNVAMLVNGEWTVNMLKADIAAGKTDIDFDMAPLPLPEGMNDPITVGGVSTFMGINPSSDKLDAAFEFVQFVTGEEGESIIADSSVLPAFSSDKTKEAFLKATGIQGSSFFFEAKTVVEN
jgi:multiple sugar transport system substrate-binding protein